MSVFHHKPNEYERNLNVRDSYIHDVTEYIATITGKNPASISNWVAKKLKDGSFKKIRDPEVLMLERDPNGDKFARETTFDSYIRHVYETKGLMSPTMAVYTDPDKKRSLLSEYIEGNIANRKVAKKAKFTALQEGRGPEAAFQHILQSTFKILNNSLSGAHASPYTILFNKSSHSTLTSTCRCLTAYANANNERFLGGNRHYHNPEVALQNVVSIIRNSDYRQIRIAIKKFGMAYPTPQQTFDSIKRSTDLYWHDSAFEKKLMRYLESCKAEQLAAFMYTSNLYEMRALNEKLIYTFLDELTTAQEEPLENYDEVINGLDDDLGAYISVLCVSATERKSWSDMRKANMTKQLGQVAATVVHVRKVIDKYSDLIKAFWVTPNQPSSVAAFTHSIRRVVLVSDTDSTIFTTQGWTNWFCGKGSFSQKAVNISAAITYIASMCTVHLLAQMSASMGIKQEKLFTLAMKNEYLMPVLIATRRAKHYTYYNSVQEGVVFKDLELETKGVALKNSKNPKHLTDELRRFITEIMDTVMREEKVSMKWAAKFVADIERSIIDSVMRGEIYYLSTARVSPREGYKNPMSSTYYFHELWNSSFSKRYGQAPEPTYQVAKVSVNANTPTKVRAWLEKMEDRQLAEDLFKFFDMDNGGRGLRHVMVPIEIVATGGIPKELLEIVDTRSIITNLMEGFYLILESLQISITDDKHTKLVSDFY